MVSRCETYHAVRAEALLDQHDSLADLLRNGLGAFNPQQSQNSVLYIIRAVRYTKTNLFGPAVLQILGQAGQDVRAHAAQGLVGPLQVAGARRVDALRQLRHLPQHRVSTASPQLQLFAIPRPGHILTFSSSSSRYCFLRRRLWRADSRFRARLEGKASSAFTSTTGKTRETVKHYASRSGTRAYRRCRFSSVSAPVPDALLSSSVVVERGPVLSVAPKAFCIC